MEAARCDRWMEFHGGDLFDDERVAAMEPAAEALLVRALWRQWTAGSLPTEIDRLRVLFPAKFHADFEQLWSQVGPWFDKLKDGRSVNSEYAARRARALRMAAKRRIAGYASAQARRKRSCKSDQARAEQVLNTCVTGVGPVLGTGQDMNRTGQNREITNPRADARGGTTLTRFWDAEWTRTRLGTRFEWIKADFVALAKCEKLATGDRKEVERRITRLLESTDRWKAENATPRVLLSQWNSLAVEVRPLTQADRVDDKIARLLNDAAVGTNGDVR